MIGDTAQCSTSWGYLTNNNKRYMNSLTPIHTTATKRIHDTVEKAANEGQRFYDVSKQGRIVIADIQINNISSVDPHALGNSLRALALAVAGPAALTHVRKSADMLAIEIYSAPVVSGQ